MDILVELILEFFGGIIESALGRKTPKLKKIKPPKERTHKGLVRHPRWISCIMAFCTLTLAGLISLFWIFPWESIRWSATWWWDVFLVFILYLLTAATLFLTLYHANTKLFLNDDHLIYQTFLRTKYKIPYRSIKTYIKSRFNVTLHTYEKTYKINISGLFGINELYAVLRYHSTEEKSSWNL
ncbi:MAG: hypothetical protein FWE08_00730 [Oscillospiraceae bacterium]|nr:hypothetical protein [Oscillospiraceae bacterium]